MLLNSSKILWAFLTLSVFGSVVGEGQSNGHRKKHKKNPKSEPGEKDKNNQKSELGKKFKLDKKVDLPDIPEVMLSEKFTTNIIFISNKGIAPLMRHIFPTYETVEKEMAELLEQFKKDYQKLNDETTRQKFTYLMETQQRIKRTEGNLAGRVCQELNKELDVAAKVKKMPVFFTTQLVPEENMPDYSLVPEIAKFVKDLEACVVYKFKQTYNKVLDQGENT